MSDFLLDMPFENLFQAVGASDKDALAFTCKTCGSTVKRWKRNEHRSEHLAERDRAETARKEQIKHERIATLTKAREARKEAA